MAHGKKATAPAILRFTAKLNADFSVTIPKPISAKLRGMETIEGIMNDQPFRASVESGSFRTNKAMREGSKTKVGETAAFAILGPEPEPHIPSDLKAAFAAHPNATVTWKQLTRLGRLDWIRWINDTQNPETRARRITRTAEQLAEGKRRACCVNVYAYMLLRMHQEGIRERVFRS